MGIVKNMAKEVIKEINTKSREFYEFVLPPVDMHHNDKNLTVIVDMPGFDKKDIKLSIRANVLSINAQKEQKENGKDTIICNQRPRLIDKRIRLPVEIKEGEEQVDSAKYEQGVLTVTIPLKHKGKKIEVE